MKHLSIILFFLCPIACKKANNEPIPTLSMSDVSVQRIVLATNMQFIATLDKAYSSEVSVEYTTEDNTAKASKDYEAKSGKLVFPANQTSVTLTIPIKGDSLRQANNSFYIKLKNPQNCTIGTASVLGVLENADLPFLPTDNTGFSTANTYANMKLVWSDEFSGKDINTSNWNFEMGNNNGWGNNELQYYTENRKNSFVSNGNLIIEARRENFSGQNYTSARMTTQNKKPFKFGRIDIRAKLPVGKGIWPALWMLGANIGTVGWPACGEIDIMELVGTFPSRVSGTAHWGASPASHVYKGADYDLMGEDFSQKFHVFSIVWEKDKIQWFVDNQLFYTNTLATVGSAPYPFNADQFFLFNVAVGGNWPGSPDATTAFPQRMFVDYVRVFQ